MLARRKRLNREAFSVVASSRLSLNRTFLSLRFICHNRALSAASVVVSKAVVKGAVLRNRTRRRLYSLIETPLKNISGVNVILYARKGAALAMDEILKKEIEKMFSEAVARCKTAKT